MRSKDDKRQDSPILASPHQPATTQFHSATSPIEEENIRSIFNMAEQHPHDVKFSVTLADTVSPHSSTLDPSQPANSQQPSHQQPQQQQTVPSSSSASNPPEQHYNDIIKDRLRMLLQKNRASYQSKRQHYQDTLDHAQQQATESQQYARDMMASMASIMKVVGDIVISTQKKDAKDKKRMRIRNIAYANQQAVHDAFTSVQSMPHATYHNPYNPYPPPPAHGAAYNYPSSTIPPLPYPTTTYETTPTATYTFPHQTIPQLQTTQGGTRNPSIHPMNTPPTLTQTTPLYTTHSSVTLPPQQHQQPYPYNTQPPPSSHHQQPYPNYPQPAQHPFHVTIQPSLPIEIQPSKPRAPLVLPRSKSAVLDMIMTKLQVSNFYQMFLIVFMNMDMVFCAEY